MNILNDPQFREKFNHIATQSDLKLGIGNLAEASGLSQSQLRYWEQKGYITSESGPKKNRKYSYGILIKVLVIKAYLEEGFTLATAAKKAVAHKQMANTLKQFVMDRFAGLSIVDDVPTINLGPVADHPDETLYAFVTPKGTELRLLPNDTDK